MMSAHYRARWPLLGVAGCAAFLLLANAGARPVGPPAATPAKRAAEIDDSLTPFPAKDLALQPANARKAEALLAYVEGARLEDNAEIENALAAYQKVLAVDPGEAELAARVAVLLTKQEDFPRAIDVLKDAIKANPKAAAPHLQLAFIYAKYLKKNDQAVKYANEGIALDPQDIDGYQRLYEIETAAGEPKKALAALDRATAVRSEDPAYWTRLGKLYATVVLKGNFEPKPEDLQRINDIFGKAAGLAKDDAAVLKDVADFYAASQQIAQAIPLYLRVLELQPDDANAREKLATGFVLTHQRPKAIEMLGEIIHSHPEKYQPYDLLAQLLDDDARALARSNQLEQAKAQFTKAAANYDQSLLINPNHATSYLRLAELLVGPVHEPERAIKLLVDARGHFPEAPEFTYLLALAQREAKQAQPALATFAEALQEATAAGSEMVNARFYFDYAIAADQAGLQDKAAELLRQSIASDPANAAEAYNYFGYMWAERNEHLGEAEEVVKHALQLDPNNGAYLDTLGWLHYRTGKFADALSELLRAAQNLKQPDPVVFDHIADTYAKLQRIPQALEYWGKAIALDPTNKAVAEKIENTKTMMSKGLAPKVDPIQ